MSQGIIHNFEYIAAHVSDYIDENKLFDVFEINDIKEILKKSNLTSKDFISLLKQSHHTIKSNQLYLCARNTKVTIQNFEEVIPILKSIRKYMKMSILDGVIDILNQTKNEIHGYTEKIEKLQTELNTMQNQKQKK